MKYSTNTIIIIFLLITIMGLVSIYSSTSQKTLEIERLIYRRQIIWIIISLIFMVLMSHFSYRRLWDWAYILYGIVLFFLLLVVILGSVRMGAQRWLKLVWLNFQPSELAKVASIIFLARYYSQQSSDRLSSSSVNLGFVRSIVVPLIFIAVPMLMILHQPDLGSALMLLFIFLVIVFLAEVRLRNIIMLCLSALLIAPLFWHLLKDYQRNRLMVFLNPNIDPLGAGYTIIQSKIAIGSGGLFGKGWLSGTQSQLHFLPESHTDFIFATFAEEWGFLGSIILLLLYFFLVRYAMDSAHRAVDRFGRLTAGGIAAMFMVQIFINIAMTIGLAPVVGLPLPLMSYGGSSLFITAISIGVLMNISKA